MLAPPKVVVGVVKQGASAIFKRDPLMVIQ